MRCAVAPPHQPGGLFLVVQPDYLVLGRTAQDDGVEPTEEHEGFANLAGVLVDDGPEVGLVYVGRSIVSPDAQHRFNPFPRRDT